MELEVRSVKCGVGSEECEAWGVEWRVESVKCVECVECVDCVDCVDCVECVECGV